jgi:hypothetical protein
MNVTVSLYLKPCSVAIFHSNKLLPSSFTTRAEGTPEASLNSRETYGITSHKTLFLINLFVVSVYMNFLWLKVAVRK